jgi:hypothetical protein
VAADAGTVVQMNSASATTITVNTALFAAGDTVQIQNVGSGICTVTAGTATVNTAGSLALSQWEGGQLYFTATGASVFFDVVQAAGGGMTLITPPVSLSGATTTIGSISQSYKTLVAFIYGMTNATADGIFRIAPNADTTNNFGVQIQNNNNTASGPVTIGGNTYINTVTGLARANSSNSLFLQINNYTNTTVSKNYNFYGYFRSTTPGDMVINQTGSHALNPAITSLVFSNAGGNMSTGTVELYGVN